MHRRTIYLLLIAASSLPALALAAPEITHGVASGDVGATSAVIWSRADRPASMTVVLESMTQNATAYRASADASADNDFAAQVSIEGLTADTPYQYRVTMSDDSGAMEQAGTFRTAPAQRADRSVSFVVAGDLGGQGYCRDPQRGYRIFEAVAALRPDFFVANGDMIYADSRCPEASPDGSANVPGEFPAIHEEDVDWTDTQRILEIYRAHWRYNRTDAPFREFLRHTPMYVQWDDHEVINDFGGPWPTYTRFPERAGYPNLVAVGRRAFLEWHPIARPGKDEARIYRSGRWGRHVDLFLLDARSYRSDNRSPDTEDEGKTMLGPAQKSWLEESLARSDATWKIVSSDVPLSIPTGSSAETLGRDAFASGDDDPFSASTGFERELFEIVSFLDRNDIDNVVFMATDVHFAAQLRYSGDYDGDGDRYVFHELINGPLSAVKMPSPRAPDATLHPTVLYAEGGLFNFAYVRIEPTASGARLYTDVRDVDGRIRPGSTLTLPDVSD